MINSDWIDRFNHAVVARRVPVSGMIELTRRCNLKCVHCYLGEGEDRSGRGEMSTAQVLDVIDQITEAGCLYLSITGGDPMMRRDFPEIYRHARQNGLLVTVMCDGCARCSGCRARVTTPGEIAPPVRGGSMTRC